MAGKKRNRGIFCLEGDWWNDYKRPSTVEHLLKVLDQHHADKLQYIHRDVHTRQSLQYLLAKWCNGRYKTHGFAYLGFHGDKGVIFVGDRRKNDSIVSLEDIGEWLEGRCEGRVLHFASCQTLNVDLRRLKKFLWQTKAAAICGYRKEIDWVDSAAFELMLFARLNSYPLTPRGIERLKLELREKTGRLWDKLRFRFETRPPAKPRRRRIAVAA
jgi:hypothetical protein